MSNYKRCPVVFNLDSPMHKDLHDWCMSRSNNFSDLVRTVLYAYKQSLTSSSAGGYAVPETPTLSVSSDAEAMSGLL
jgi:hypothetical protein